VIHIKWEESVMSDTPDDQQISFVAGDRLIRRQWVEDRWFFSLVDVIAVLTKSDTPRRIGAT
jgi:hypothetical protein